MKRTKRKKKLNGFQLKQKRNFLGNTKEITEHLQRSNNKEMFYHITLPDNWKSIQKQGLKGGKNDYQNHSKYYGNDFFSLKGKLYLLDTDDKRVWNGVSTNQIQTFRLNKKKKDRKSKNLNYNKMLKFMDLKRDKRNGKPYVVIGIPKELFRFLGITIHNDPTDEPINRNNTHKYVELGNQSINPKFLSVVYNGIGDLKKHMEEEVWEIYYECRKKEDPTIQMEDLSIGMGGDSVFYKDRKYKSGFNNEFILNDMIQSQSIMKGNE